MAKTNGNAKTSTIKATDAAAEETWTIGGRTLTKDDNGFSWHDTGEEVGAEEAAGLVALAETETAAGDPKECQKQNTVILFWAPEVPSEAANGTPGPMVPNPIRGLPLGFFRRPEWSNDEEEAGDEKANENADKKADKKRPKLACWVLLTRSTYAKNRDKKWQIVPPGKIVWVDVSQAFADLPAAAAPTFAPDGTPTSLVEVAINPLYKRPIPSAPGSKEPRQAWVMDWYGGRMAARHEGWRVLNAEQIKKLGPLTRVPFVSRIRPEDFPELPGSETTAPQLPEAAGRTIDTAPEYDQTSSH